MDAKIGLQTITLVHKGGGEYQAIVNTESLTPGTISVSFTAEKSGYTGAIDTETFKVTAKPSQPAPGGLTSVDGIPGFPYESQIFGITAALLAIFLAKRTLSR
jgi:hypothetical protein